MKSRVLTAAVAAGVAMALAASGVAIAQNTTGTPVSYLNGVVVSTDVGASTVTLRSKSGPARTVHVDSAAAAQLGRLKAGDPVILTVRAGRAIDIKLSAASARPGPLTPPAAPPVPTPPAPPTLYPGPPASPGPMISPTPNPWRTPPAVPTPRPVPTPKRVFPSPEFTVPPSPGPSPTPTPNPG